MENKLQNAGQNSIMRNYVKTDNILKDMCGIIESSQKSAYQAVNTLLVQRNSNLYSFYSFYKTYPEIFQTSSGKSEGLLSWSHYAVLLQVKDQ